MDYNYLEKVNFRQSPPKELGPALVGAVAVIIFYLVTFFWKQSVWLQLLEAIGIVSLISLASYGRRFYHHLRPRSELALALDASQKGIWIWSQHYRRQLFIPFNMLKSTNQDDYLLTFTYQGAFYFDRRQTPHALPSGVVSLITRDLESKKNLVKFLQAYNHLVEKKYRFDFSSKGSLPMRGEAVWLSPKYQRVLKVVAVLLLCVNVGNVFITEQKRKNPYQEINTRYIKTVSYHKGMVLKTKQQELTLVNAYMAKDIDGNDIVIFRIKKANNKESFTNRRFGIVAKENRDGTTSTVTALSGVTLKRQGQEMDVINLLRDDDNVITQNIDWSLPDVTFNVAFKWRPDQRQYFVSRDFSGKKPDDYNDAPAYFVRFSKKDLEEIK